MKQRILLISHCFLNDAAKLRNQNAASISKERDLKRAFIKQMLSQDVELIQLPCPEFLIYGSNRWRHVSNQFNTPHFREESRKMLTPFIMQLEEYCAYPDRYEVLGILGIDGSPSCGVNYTCEGEWGGDFMGIQNPSSMAASSKKVPKQGIFMDILKEMLHEKHLPVRLYSLDTFASISGTAERRDASQVDLSLYGSDKTEKKSVSSPPDTSGINLL